MGSVCVHEERNYKNQTTIKEILNVTAHSQSLYQQLCMHFNFLSLNYYYYSKDFDENKKLQPLNIISLN